MKRADEKGRGDEHGFVPARGWAGGWSARQRHAERGEWCRGPTRPEGVIHGNTFYLGGCHTRLLVLVAGIGKR
jgi:hypothetical protein